VYPSLQRHFLENNWRICDELLLFIGRRYSYHLLSFVREDMRNLFLGLKVLSFCTMTVLVIVDHIVE
jgi:hypothetical protein